MRKNLMHLIYMCARVWICVCVCVCVCFSDNLFVCMYGWGRKTTCLHACVCVFEREREVPVCACACKHAKMHVRVCVWGISWLFICVHLGECLFVCVLMYVCVSEKVPVWICWSQSCFPPSPRCSPLPTSVAALDSLPWWTLTLWTWSTTKSGCRLLYRTTGGQIHWATRPRVCVCHPVAAGGDTVWEV